MSSASINTIFGFMLFVVFIIIPLHGMFYMAACLRALTFAYVRFRMTAARLRALTFAVSLDAAVSGLSINPAMFMHGIDQGQVVVPHLFRYAGYWISGAAYYFMILFPIGKQLLYHRIYLFGGS